MGAPSKSQRLDLLTAREFREREFARKRALAERLFAEEAELSNVDLAQRVGLSAHTVSKWRLEWRKQGEAA